MRTRCLLLLLATAAGLAGCSEAAPSVVELHGETMGTTYSIRLAELPAETTREQLQAGIDERLELVNAQMSNWREDSELSRFNASREKEWFEVSPATAKVVAAAIETSRETQGAFDVTVGALIDLWGFGAAGRRNEPPTDDELAAVRESVGWEKLEVRTDPPALKKSHPELTVNLSAIAKGYGVDVVAEYLDSLGATAYLVEIGGEVRLRGKKPDGSTWRIGIERPQAGARSLDTTIALTDAGLATSGDYRNFFERDGQRFSHTLNPATGRPVEHSLASVTVVADDTMTADATATALMVMGPESGYDYAEQREIPVLFIVHEGQGFCELTTSAWDRRFYGDD